MSSGISTFLCRKQRSDGSGGKCNKKRAKETTRWRLGRTSVRVGEAEVALLDLLTWVGFAAHRCLHKMAN